MKATIIVHQGWADLFSNNGLINYYCEFFQELIVFVTCQNRKTLMTDIFKNNDKVKIKIPKIHHEYNGIDSCLECMCLGNPYYCPRINNKKCIYIDYTFYKDFENIKVGSFNHYNNWEQFRYNNYLNNISFSHCFYLYNNIDISNRINKFQVSRNPIKEQQNYDNLIKDIGDKYIVTHEDEERNLTIKQQIYNPNNLPIYNLDKKSINMIDQILIIQNSQEIHLIDSSYSVFIYFLYFLNNEFKEIPTYLYKLNRTDRDTLIYTNPTHPSWIFI